MDTYIQQKLYWIQSPVRSTRVSFSHHYGTVRIEMSIAAIDVAQGKIVRVDE